MGVHNILRIRFVYRNKNAPLRTVQRDAEVQRTEQHAWRRHGMHVANVGARAETVESRVTVATQEREEHGSWASDGSGCDCMIMSSVSRETM